MVEKAYSKINITLDVKDLRDDGYHNIESVILPLEFHDSLEVSILPKSTPDDFVVCDDFSLRISKYNLVHKTIDLCRAKWGFKERLNVNINKNIYLQAGLGGGSADAAAILRTIIRMFKLTPTEEEIKEICLKAGSDVYYQYYNKPALVSGKGDKLEFFDCPLDFYVLLVKPLLGNSTEAVFTEADQHDLIHGDSRKTIEALKTKDLKEIQKTMFNSLFEPAKILCSEIEEVYNELKSLDFDAYGMTGSGSCLFALSYDKKKLEKAEKHFFLRGYQSDLTKIHN